MMDVALCINDYSDSQTFNRINRFLASLCELEKFTYIKNKKINGLQIDVFSRLFVNRIFLKKKNSNIKFHQIIYFYTL